MANKKLTLIAVFAIMTIAAWSQPEKKPVEFLPYDHYFDPLILDPIECQSFGAVYAFWEGSEFQENIYSPLAVGFQLPVVHWDHGDHGFEIGFMTTVYFQFEFINPTNQFFINLINTDFKVGVPFVYRKNSFALRTSLYHVSSHFSEEYIFRYGLKTFGENKNTYEALEVQASWQWRKLRYYGGIDMAFNSPYSRGIWTFQGGFLFRSPVKQGSKFNYVGGADLQVLQETEWSLNTMLGAGIELVMRPGRTFQVMLQFYNGNLPYSQYTHLKVKYLGATLIGHPF